MIARWMLYGLAITAVLALAGVLAERIATVFRWPRRFGWAAALVVAIICTAVAPWRNRAPVINMVKSSPSTIGVSARELPAFIMATPKAWSVTGLLERGRTIVGNLVTWATPAEPLLRLGWILGALLLVLTYALGVVVLTRRRRTWTPRQVDGIDVLVALRDGPAVLGLLHPRIVLPEWALGLDAPSRALMIRHECEHLRARDPLLLHAASLALIVMPWNAAAWWIVYRLRLAIELDCDARVLHGTGCSSASAAEAAPRYGQLLLDVATHRSPESMRIAPALLEHTSSLSRRIAAMYPDRLRFPRMQGALAAASTVCLLVLAAEMPVPRLAAQEPSMERLVGSATAAPAPMLSVASTRALLQKYYPDVLRGEGPRSVGFIRDLSGRVIGAMSAHEAEMLVGEIRGREERRAEPAREDAMLKEQDVALTVDGRIEAATRVNVGASPERGYAVTQEQVAASVVDILRQRLDSARKVADEHPSSRDAEQIRVLESQLREAQQKYAAKREYTPDNRDIEQATTVLKTRVEQLDAERTRAGEQPVEGGMKEPRPAGLGSLAERTVAIDVVRHASGLFGREPVNIFFVTRNGPY